MICYQIKARVSNGMQHAKHQSEAGGDPRANFTLPSTKPRDLENN